MPRQEDDPNMLTVDHTIHFSVEFVVVFSLMLLSRNTFGAESPQAACLDDIWFIHLI